MAALTTSEIKVDGQILSRIPVLVGQSNYSIWHVKSFCAMILLSHLPNDMFTLTSTITQTVAVANFDLETIASRILAEIDLWATC